jgi:hypothetical protein
MSLSRSALVDALLSAGPASDRAAKLGLYGWLVGSWALDGVFHNPDGGTGEGRGEMHAGWALAGRALQDVWIVPPRDALADPSPEWARFYGTTLRVYDPGIDAWHILWSDPLKQAYRRMVGCPRGRDIVQDGVDQSGAAVRWSFTEIAPRSFRWTAERSPDGGANWRTIIEFAARRTAG